MLKKFTILKFAALSAAFLFLFAFSTSFPSGNTGAPGDNTCASCHSGGGGGFDGTLTLSGLPSNPDPSTMYSLTMDIDVTAGSPVRGGFSILALDNANDANAGTFMNNDGNSEIKFIGSKIYWGHQPALSFSGGNASYDVDWMSPNITDDVTFYMSSVLGNGSGTGGDKVLLEELTVTIVGTVPIDLDFSSTPTSCYDGNDGTASVVATGGTPPYDYDWDNGDDMPMLMNLEPGNYEVTVTDDVGSQQIGQVNVGEADEIETDPEIFQISCPGEDDGEVFINPFGGTGDLECDWGFDVDCDQNDLEPGFYSVTITDDNNCSIVQTIEIFDAEPIIITMSSMESDNGMNGTATAEPDGGTGFYEFTWSNGAQASGNISTISNLAPGTYSVTVVDQNDCLEVNSVTVTGGGCILSVMPNATDVTCNGFSDGSISLNITGGNGNPSYLWSNGSTAASLDSISGGMYSVTVSEGGACPDVTASIMVNEPDALSATTLVLVNPSCAELDNGRLTVGLNGGVGDYSLQWAHGPSNDTVIMGLDTIINIPDTLTQLAVGTYAYTLTDGNQCSIVDSLVLNNGDNLAPFVMLTDVTVELDATGTAPALDFSAIDNGSFDNCGIQSVSFDTGEFSCADIGVQEYPINITDTNGNVASSNATIVVVEYIDPEIDCSQSSMTTNSCQPISYAIPLATDNCDIASLELVSGLASGSIFPAGANIVTYRASDSCGNSAECSFTITVNNDFVVTSESTDTNCGFSDGSISVTATGGTPPYDYQPFQMADNIMAGTYSITVTDAVGCMDVETIEVLDNSADFSINASSNSISCSGLSDGSISVTPSGGASPYTVSLNSGPAMDVPMVFMDLSAGQYELLLTDNNGCQKDSVVVLDEPLPLAIEVNETGIDSCTGIIDLDDIVYTATGGTPPYDVSFENDGDNEVISIVDDNGCEISTTINTIVVGSVDVVSFELMPEVSANSGGVDITVEGGNAPYGFEWYDENGVLVSSSEDLVDVSAGIYSLIIIDGNGCRYDFEYEVPLETSTVNLDIANEFAVLYPSPVSNLLNIEFKTEIANSLTIFDVHGQNVKYLNNLTGKTTINVADYHSGIYVIKLEYDNRTFVKSFLKQ